MAAPTLLDIGAARKIARHHVRLRNELDTCWQPPEGVYNMIAW